MSDEQLTVRTDPPGENYRREPTLWGIYRGDEPIVTGIASSGRAREALAEINEGRHPDWLGEAVWHLTP